MSKIHNLFYFKCSLNDEFLSVFSFLLHFKFESFEKSVELSRERQFLRSARKKIVGKIDKLAKIDKLFLLYFVATMTNE